MQKITTFLTFNDQAGEVMNFQVSIFRNSKIVSVGCFHTHSSALRRLAATMGDSNRTHGTAL